MEIVYIMLFTGPLVGILLLVINTISDYQEQRKKIEARKKSSILRKKKIKERQKSRRL